MSLVCSLIVFSDEDAAAICHGSKSAEEMLTPPSRRGPLPWGCAVISLPAFAFIIAMFWRLVPSLPWLWCISFGGMWFLMNGLHWRLFNSSRIRGTDKSVAAPEGPLTSRPELNLDKAWHGLHYLMTGSDDDAAEPLGYLLSGGEEVADSPAGPSRLLDPEQVRHFYQAILAITPDELRARFDAKHMMALEIYPNLWDQPGEADWLVGEFQRLRSFLQEQVAMGDRWLMVTLG